MVGLCGVLQPGARVVEEVVATTQWTDRERRNDYLNDDVWVTSSSYPSVATEQPAASSDDGALVWCFGSIHGVETPYRYETRPDRMPDHVYCAELYRRYGVDFASRVNGTFVAIIYDPDTGVVSFVSDRLGTHPIFHARTREGGIAFSTNVQSLVYHPDVETSFHPEYLAEYCTLGRVGGIYTPYRDVTQLQPASVTRVELDSLDVESERYWEPIYRPLSQSFDYFVDEFTELFQRIIDERRSAHERVGLLLSGGSDSRLLLSQITNDAVGYHLSDWMSQEARTAERVALETGIEFHWLRRGANYHETLLDQAAPMMNFTGRFEQAHIAGYVDQLTDEVDTLVSGLFADTLFRGLAVPKRTVSLGPLGRLTLPVAESIDSVDDYLSRFPAETAKYLTTTPIRDILRKNITVHSDGRVVDHGVEYASLREFVLYNDLFPLTSDADLFYWSLEQTMPHWTPFLDNRMLDLSLQLPIRYRLRRNLSNAAMERLSPRLASVPNASSGIPPAWPFLLDFVGRNLTALKRNVVSNDTPPQPYFQHHPWTYYPELLRHHRFPFERLQKHREIIENLPDIRWELVTTCFDEHTAGAQHALELYTLLSVLEMPATARLAEQVDSPSIETEREAMQ